MRDVVYLVIAYLSLAISLVTLGVELWAVTVAVLLPAEGYRAAGKSTKPVWAGVLGVIAGLNLLVTLASGGPVSWTGLLGLIMVIVAGVFLADVKPAVQEVLRSSSRRGRGPLGLW